MKHSGSLALSLIAVLILSDLRLGAQPPSPVASQPGFVQAASSVADSCSLPACKVCVSVPKATTKKVYACKEEQYCLPFCSLLSLLHGDCTCDDGNCGDLRVRHRLVVKKVAGCDGKQCVPKELPIACSEPCAAPIMPSHTAPVTSP